MARIWENRLEAGTKAWAQCGIAGRQDDVDVILRQDVATGRITEEQYAELTALVTSTYGGPAPAETTPAV